MADRDYEMGPATEMMVNDFDDERTLDEEEALEGSEDSHNELSNLQKEGDMPLKDLLAMYGYRDPSTENSNSSDRMILPPGGVDAEGDGHYSDKGDNDADDDDDDDEADTASNEPDLKQFYTEMLVKGKDSTSATTGSTTKRKSTSSTRSTASRRRRNNNENNDEEDDDEEEEDEDEDEAECNMMDGNGNAASATSGRGVNASTCVGGNHGTMSGLTGGSVGCGASDGAGNNTSGVVGNLGDGNVADGNTGNSGAVGDSEDAIVGGGGGGGTSRLLRSVSRPQSEEEEDDCDYSPDEEEWKKTIMVGSDYQAAIPEGLCRYDDALPYENEDKMLWDPSHIPEEETEEFLERAQLPAVKGGSLPAGSHVRDDEQALYLLLQCGYNLEEALRRRRMNVIPPTDAVSLWSEEECHNFESGLRTYGKDFHLIQKNKVRTRSVGELVQFYYLWKKTERHDIFTFKARLEKKKYALHPGITDYMDRFLEEQEGVRDRSSSPNVHYLLYGDAKRQRSSSGVTNNDDLKSESWDVNAVDPLADVNGPTAGVPSLAPPLPPPPPGPATTAVPGGTPSNVVANSNASSTAMVHHMDCSTSDSNCPSVWSGMPPRSQSTSSTATNMAVDSAGNDTNSSSSNTATAVVIATSATSNNAPHDVCHHRGISSSRGNDSARRDSPSPENILPHLPP